MTIESFAQLAPYPVIVAAIAILSYIYREVSAYFERQIDKQHERDLKRDEDQRAFQERMLQDQRTALIDSAQRYTESMQERDVQWQGFLRDFREAQARDIERVTRAIEDITSRLIDHGQPDRIGTGPLDPRGVRQ